MKNLKNYFTTNKFKHGTMATIFTAIFIAVIIFVNVIASVLNQRFPSMNIDMTPSQSNTLTEVSAEAAKEAKVDTRICIIGDEKAYRDDLVYAEFAYKYGGGFSSNQVVSIAEKMAEINPKISVEFIDPDVNPDFITKYSSDNLEQGCVVVVTEKRHKTLDANDFFALSTDQATQKTKTYSMVDGALSNAVHIVNLDNVPVIAVATGHDEILTASQRYAFDSKMQDNGFLVQEFDVLKDEIPEEAQVVMLAAPKTDYSESEIEKLKDFLSYDQEYRTLFVTTHPMQGDTPNLDALYEQWGIEIGEGYVFETNSDKMISATDPSIFLVDVNSEFTGDKEYGRNLSVAASPIKFLFETNGNIATKPIYETSDDAYVVVQESDRTDNPDTSKQITAGVSQTLTNTDNGVTYTNVLVMDAASLSNNYIGTTSFDNGECVVDLLQNFTGVTDEKIGIYVQKVETTNVYDIQTTVSVITALGLYVGVFGIPLTILVIGLVIFLRRRHL